MKNSKRRNETFACVSQENTKIAYLRQGTSAMKDYKSFELIDARDDNEYYLLQRTTDLLK
jgi:hypothetical protein